MSIFYSSCCSLLSQDIHSFPLRSSFKFCLPPTPPSDSTVIRLSAGHQLPSFQFASFGHSMHCQLPCMSTPTNLHIAATVPGFHPGICLCCNRFSLWNFIFGAICYAPLGCLIRSHLEHLSLCILS